uniref:hypothetical protein n=1 Tax=Paenibacillus xylanexedens TaxID=528191 RepID=UPI001C92C8BC
NNRVNGPGTLRNGGVDLYRCIDDDGEENRGVKSRWRDVSLEVRVIKRIFVVIWLCKEGGERNLVGMVVWDCLLVEI